MVSEIEESESKPVSLVGRVKNLLGVGLYLLLLGLFLEAMTLLAQPWASVPVSLALGTQILVTVPCVSVCLLGVIWFNRTLDLFKVHFLNGTKELVTAGPFAYVRHPLYATLLLTIPPLFVFWLSDLLFVVPWALMIVIAHLVVRLEERGLVEEFGSDYERYRKVVPALLPYKGAGGKRLRGKGDEDMDSLQRPRKTFEELAAQFDAAWNARDARALAALCTADADMQYWTGKTVSGREQIEQAYALAVFASMPADMRHTSVLDRFRLLRPDVAIGDGSVRIKGSAGPDQPAVDLSLLFTSVAVLQEGEWRIAAIRLMIPQAQ